MFFAAKVWHYWIAWALIIPSMLLFLSLGVGYLMKVVRPKYRGQ
jgi:hypothetical protein